MVDYYKGVKNVLESLDIENDIIDENYDGLCRLIKLLELDKKEEDNYVFSTKSVGFDKQDDVLFINGKDIKKMLDAKSISKQIKNVDAEKAKKIDKYIFINSIEEKIRLTKNVRQNLNAQYVFLPAGECPESFDISIDSRLNRITKSIVKNDENQESSAVFSYLYAAKLYDLVNLYNTIGDGLFDKNVRAGISKDVTGVKSSIMNTLEKEPEHFWFYNNGITMIANNVSHFKKNSININLSSSSDVSIINGAQTINACAEYFYRQVNKTIVNKEGKTVDNPAFLALERAKQDAYVLLRIVSAEENKDIEKKVSISLNKQKPIDSEDLAYSVDLVFAINALFEEVKNSPTLKQELSNITFRIVRKGDNLINRDAYSLTELGQLIRAAKLQIPGKAKNTYKGNMLKLADSESKLKDKDVFVDLDDKHVDDFIELKDSFIENYGLVNISSKLLSIWNAQKDYIDLSAPEYEALANSNSKVSGSGNFYFIAMVIWALFVDVQDEASVKYTNTVKPRLEVIKEAYSNLKNSESTILASFYRCIQKDVIDNGSLTMEELKADARYKKLFSDKSNMYEFRTRVRSAIFSKTISSVEGNNKDSEINTVV